MLRTRSSGAALHMSQVRTPDLTNHSHLMVPAPTLREHAPVRFMQTLYCALDFVWYQVCLCFVDGPKGATPILLGTGPCCMLHLQQMCGRKFWLAGLRRMFGTHTCCAVALGADNCSVAGADDLFMRGFGADLDDALPGLASRRNVSDASAFINR